MKKRAAFTLIELLVVVAIVAVLIAILVPSLSSAKEQARKAACLANVRTCVTGCILYAQDWANALPYPTTGGPPNLPNPPAPPMTPSPWTVPVPQLCFWFNAIDPELSKSSNANPTVVSGQTRYYSSFKQDPVFVNLSNSKPFSSSSQTFQQYSRTLKFNTNCRKIGFLDTAGNKVYGPALLSDITSQGDAEANFVLIGDAVAVDLYPPVASSTASADPTSTETAAFSFDTTDRTQGGVGIRHAGFANMGFADGHAESLKFPTYKRPIVTTGGANPTNSAVGGAGGFSTTVFVDAWQSEFVDASGNQVFSSVSSTLSVAGLNTPSPAYLDNRYTLGSSQNAGIQRNPNMTVIFQIPGFVGR